MRRCLLFLAFVTLAAGWWSPVLSEEIPLSVAERSGFTRTATEDEIDQLLEATAKADQRMVRWTMGQSTEGRPIQGLKIGFAEEQSRNESQLDSRMTVIIIGGIHSGECAGKEALFDITRAIAAGRHDQWLTKIRLVVIPSLSPDSNSRRALDNRPGQIGPSDGMGTRANAQGLDLNRDFIKLESPEIRALVSAMNQFDADVLIDLHTTNGSQHRYELTYDPPHHPMTPKAVRNFLRGKLLPSVTDTAAQRGISLFYYGNFDRSHSRWSTYGYEGRYSTNYTGLRGKLGILSEAYSYASYPKRIEASRVFMEEVLDYLTANSTAVSNILDSKPEWTVGSEVGLTAQLAPFPEPYKVRGYRPDPAASGEAREEYDYEVQFYGDFRADTIAKLPRGYFIEGENEKITELLTLHGVKFERRKLEQDFRLEAFTISRCDEAAQAFQGHRMVQLDGSWNPYEIEGGQGIWIDCEYPLAALAAVILEPQSADSIANWNVVPAVDLQPGVCYPVLRVLPSD